MAVVPLRFDLNTEGVERQVSTVNSQLKRLGTLQEKAERESGANIGAIRAHYHTLMEKQIAKMPSVHEQANAKIVEGLKKRHSIELEAEQLSSRTLEKVLAEKEEFVKNLYKRQQQYAGTAIAEELRLKKNAAQEEVEIYRKVRNQKEGSQGKGIYGIVSTAMNSSGIGGGNLSSIVTGLGTTAGTVAAVAGVGIAFKKTFEQGLELEHELKEVAVGYQTVGLNAREAFIAARMDEGLIANEANKFGILSSKLREAEGAYLNVGGSQEGLKSKIELIVGVQERMKVGFAEAGQLIAKVMNPEVSGRLAQSLVISAEAMKNAKTETERYNLIMGVLKGTIQGVADQSHDAEGNITRATNSLHEGWKKAGQTLVQNLTPAIDGLGESLNFVLNGFRSEIPVVERNITEHEREVKIRKEAEQAALNQKVAIEELIATYDKEGKELDVQYKASFVNFAKDKAAGNEAAANMDLFYGKYFEAQIKARKAQEDAYDLATGAKDPKKEKREKSVSVDNPLKAAQTRFELYAIEMKYSKERIEIGLLEIQIKYDNLIAEQAKKGSDIQIDHLLAAAHAKERIREIELASEMKFLESVKKGRELEDKFEEEIAHKQIELNKEVMQARAKDAKEANDELSLLMRERLDILNDDLREANAETKKYTDIAKKSLEELLSPVTDQVKSLFDKLPKGIGSFASGVMKIGIDNVAKSLFDKKEQKTEIDTALIHITNASLFAELPNIGAPKTAEDVIPSNVTLPPGFTNDFVNKKDMGNGTKFKEGNGLIEYYNDLNKQFEEAEKKRLAELHKLLNETGEISQGDKPGSVKDNTRFTDPDFYKKTLHQSLGIAEVGLTASTVMGIGGAGAHSLLHLGKDGLKEAGGHIALQFADALKEGKGTDIGKTIAGGILSIVPGGGLLSGITSLFFASGGIVPQYFAVGGRAKGTDTVPAWLTPGETVRTAKQEHELNLAFARMATSSSYSGGMQYSDGITKAIDRLYSGISNLPRTFVTTRDIQLNNVQDKYRQSRKKLNG